MSVIKHLLTSKRIYADVVVFHSMHEAEDNGYHVLYHDDFCKGTICGKPMDDNYPKLLTVGFVPDPVSEKHLFSLTDK